MSRSSQGKEMHDVMDTDTTMPALLTRPAKLAAESGSEKASPLFKLVTAVAFLVLLYIVFVH
jgi:hypothetical protein